MDSLVSIVILVKRTSGSLLEATKDCIAMVKARMAMHEYETLKKAAQKRN